MAGNFSANLNKYLQSSIFGDKTNAILFATVKPNDQVHVSQSPPTTFFLKTTKRQYAALSP